jgi:hypothetical protein
MAIQALAEQAQIKAEVLRTLAPLSPEVALRLLSSVATDIETASGQEAPPGPFSRRAANPGVPPAPSRGPVGGPHTGLRKQVYDLIQDRGPMKTRALLKLLGTAGEDKTKVYNVLYHLRKDRMLVKDEKTKAFSISKEPNAPKEKAKRSPRPRSPKSAPVLSPASDPSSSSPTPSSPSLASPTETLSA